MDVSFHCFFSDLIAGSQKVQPPQHPPPKIQDYSALNTFNTAPRGWQPKMDYYRPVFLDPGVDVPVFTDF